MLPLRDTIPSRTPPIVALGIGGLSVLVFLVELGQGQQLGRFLAEYGLVPLRYFWLADQHPEDFVARFGPVGSAIFVHQGWLHLLGNMGFLWIFGPSLEDRLGHGRFLAFYLAVGCVAGIVQVHWHPNGPLPVVGSSGALIGLLGAYLLLFPRSRVLTAVPVPFYLQVVEVPAVLFLGLWFFLQLLVGSTQPGRAIGEFAGGFSGWAQLAGFATGMLLGAVLSRRKARKRKTYPTREIFHPW